VLPTPEDGYLLLPFGDKEVVLMSDYELLMIVFTVMGILVAVLIEYIKK
jgi:hypothetical protein